MNFKKLWNMELSIWLRFRIHTSVKVVLPFNKSSVFTKWTDKNKPRKLTKENSVDSVWENLYIN